MNYGFICCFLCSFFFFLPVSLHGQGYFIEWADTVDNGDTDIGWAVAVDRSNNIIVTGQSDIGADEDYLTIKYDPDGAILWADTLDNGSYDIAYAVITDGFNEVCYHFFG